MLDAPVLDIPDIDIPERESRTDWSEEAHPRAADGKFTSGTSEHDTKLDKLINNHIAAAKAAAMAKKGGDKDVQKAATKEWQDVHAQLKKFAASHPNPAVALGALAKAIKLHGKKDIYLGHALQQTAKAVGVGQVTEQPTTAPAVLPPPPPPSPSTPSSAPRQRRDRCGMCSRRPSAFSASSGQSKRRSRRRRPLRGG